VLGQILTEFRGRVRIVYKDFPLTRPHPLALGAAEAARCAGVQGAYWEYHDMLFMAQPFFSRAELLNYAGRLGLKTDAFGACLDSGRFREAIEADQREGRAAGVEGTPTFFVNGRMLEGTQPVETFREVIQSALRAAPAKRPSRRPDSRP
jgi:protein-disulfide isomerase